MVVEKADHPEEDTGKKRKLDTIPENKIKKRKFKSDANEHSKKEKETKIPRSESIAIMNQTIPEETVKKPKPAGVYFPVPFPVLY